MKQMYVSEATPSTAKAMTEKLKGTAYQMKAGDIHFSSSPFPDVEVLVIRSATTVDANILSHFPHLKAVIRLGMGLDNVDRAFCKSHDIQLFNAPGANSAAVVEYVVAMMLYIRRKLHLITKEDIKKWDRFKFIGQDITAQTIGIIGFGNIGSRLQAKLACLGCKNFLVCDPYIDPVKVPPEVRLTSLEEVLAKSDTVTFHVPLTAETTHLIDAERLALLKNGAMLLNASRGGVVDEKALLKIIEPKELTFVADTVENEPKVNSALLEHPQVIVTPHVAGLSKEIEFNVVNIALNNFFEERAVQ